MGLLEVTQSLSGLSLFTPLCLKTSSFSLIVTGKKRKRKGKEEGKKKGVKKETWKTGQ